MNTIWGCAVFATLLGVLWMMFVYLAGWNWLIGIVPLAIVVAFIGGVWATDTIRGAEDTAREIRNMRGGR